MAGTFLSAFLAAPNPWLALDGTDSDRWQATLGSDPVVALARQGGTGLVLDSCSAWAGQARAEGVGLTPDHLGWMNAAAINFALGLRARWSDLPTLINGMVGPLAQNATADISAWHARMAHSAQIHSLARAGAEVITAAGMTHVAEAIGIAGAATAAGLPCIVSFAVTAQGRLSSGQALDEAIFDIEQLDTVPLFYGIEGDDIPESLFDPAQDWVQRIGALRMGGADATAIDRLAPRLPGLRMIGAPGSALHRFASPTRDALALGA